LYQILIRLLFILFDIITIYLFFPIIIRKEKENVTYNRFLRSCRRRRRQL